MALATSLVGFTTQSHAMKLVGEETTYSKVYKPTKSAVKKAMDKMGYQYTVDDDGDLEFKIDGKSWVMYVIFDEMGSGKIWNLQLLAQFSTKKSRYDELVEYANTWNAGKKFPKISMKDQDSLKLTMNYPVQYGFNPDEFEENVIGMFEKYVKKIAEETDAMRK